MHGHTIVKITYIFFRGKLTFVGLLLMYPIYEIRFIVLLVTVLISQYYVRTCTVSFPILSLGGIYS